MSTVPNHATAPDGLRAGVVGLGTIGGGVAASLVRSGRMPAVFDVRAQAAAELPGVPPVLAGAADVARASDVVMVAVLDAEQARTAIGGPGGLLDGAHDDLVIALLSTVSLAAVHGLAETVRKAGARFLDCGVTNPGRRARENGLVAFVGGDDETVARALPVLEDWAAHVEHCGPLGAGMAAKIARNIITYGCWRVVHEASLLVEGAGVDMDRVMHAIDVADPTGSTLFQLRRMRGTTGPVGPDQEQAMRAIDYFVSKDLDAAQELARDLAVEVPVVDVTLERRAQMLGLDGA